VRLPLLPSALADITLATLAVRALPERWMEFVLLLLASGCLYLSGMVFNDYFDLDEDKRDRPDRPLPSGKITPRAALLAGLGLMTAGVMLAFLVGLLSGFLAVALVLAIFLYDAVLKASPIGPVAMGFCRFLNILLGVSICGGVAWPLGLHLASVVGLYIVGVTWFARQETHTSNRNFLTAAACVILAALLLALPLPLSASAWQAGDTASPGFVYLLVATGFLIGLPLERAIREPQPKQVQAAVGRCLMCLVLLDATLALATAGSWGMVLLLLMVPGLWLRRRRMYVT
jgi:4-hydroxybenzoate polyprenyltransferase